MAMTEREKAIQKSLTLLSSLYPHLASILDSVQRYTDDVATQVRRAEGDKAEALRQQERRLYAEFEGFFEGKIRELVLARQKAEARAEAEHAAAFAVRKERDTELVEVKKDLIQRLNECEHTEEQFRDFRHLIASVFQTNQQLTLRIDQLESVLARHRIDIPPASAELSAYSTSTEAKVDGGATSSGGGGGSTSSGSGEVRALATQVPVAFMAAANAELVKSRLTLQQELLHSAFDDHSAYRLKIEGLTRENRDLTFHIAELEEKVRELYTYIHQKRFITRVDEYGNETTPLTPRPREVPLALQTELGIELRHSTADILTELSTVAINMKHQLNSALLRSRQLNALSTWLNEGDVSGDISTAAKAVTAVVQQVNEAAVIPVFPVSSWPAIPHFLRTNVAPEVRNCFWTEAQIGCILYNFFASYKSTRARARFVRDGKMLAPRVFQLFEHRRVLLTRLDVSKEEAARSERNIPFGYVVSQFAREVLTQLSPQNAQDALPLVLPGTIATRYPLNPPARAAGAALTGATTTKAKGSSSLGTKAKEEMRVEDCEWVEAAPVVELEWTRFTYNMWYAAMRYQTTQPLCQLFIDLVDGQLPLETFDVMEKVLARVQRLVDQLDNDRSHRFTYSRLANGVVRWVNDVGAQAVLRGVQAVVQSFKSQHCPIHGGTLTPLAIFADETYCEREEEAASSISAEEATHHQPNSFVPANCTLAAKAATAAAAAHEKPRTPLPGCLLTRALPRSSIGATTSTALALPPLGATVFVRYWRNFVRNVLERTYTRIESVLAPLVEESDVVIGLYLLPVPRAQAVLAELDNVERQAALRAAMFGGSGAGGVDAFSLAGRNPEDMLTGAKLVAEAADLLGVNGMARSFLTLLESRKDALQVKKTAERHVATETVLAAVRQLPRFKIATHFPFGLQRHGGDAEDDDECKGSESEPGAEGGGLKSPRTPPAPATANDASTSADKKSGKKAAKKATGRSPRRNTQKGVKTRTASPTDANGDPMSYSPEMSESSPLGQRSKQADSAKRRKRSSSTNPMGGPTSPLTSSQKGKEVNAANVMLAADVMASSTEGELVEWYSLRHTLRQTMPDFPYVLFQLDEYERATEAETSANALVLKAYEESLPTVAAEEEKKS